MLFLISIFLEFPTSQCQAELNNPKAEKEIICRCIPKPTDMCVCVYIYIYIYIYIHTHTHTTQHTHKISS